MENVYMNSLLGRAEAEFESSNKVGGKSELGKEDFITLLVAQLNQQDPLNPMDDKEFTAQMAEFSSLEQLTNINDNIQLLAESGDKQEMLTAVSFIDKEVKAQGYDITKDGDYMSTVYYGFDQPVVNMFMNIYDENGNLVKTVDMESKQAGYYEYDWDGTNWAGEEVPDGVYSVAMAGETADGQPVLISTEVSGVVSAVLSDSGQHYLRLKDGRILNFNNVTEVVGSVPEESDPEESTEG